MLQTGVVLFLIDQNLTWRRTVRGDVEGIVRLSLITVCVDRSLLQPPRKQRNAR